MLAHFYYDRLSPKEARAYDELRSAIERGRESHLLYDMDESQSDRIMDALRDDCPELYDCIFILKQRAREPRGTRVYFEYAYTDSYKMQIAIDQALQSVEEKIGRSGSPYLIAKCVYDYLAKNVEYDYETFVEYMRLFSETNSEQRESALRSFVETYGNCFTAYGALVEKKAVCMGIAMAYKLLMDRLNVETACISGKVDSVNHMMNLVELDYQVTFCDVTCGMLNPNLPMVRYDYFLVPASYVEDYFESDINCDFTSETEKLHYFARKRLDFSSVRELRKYLNSFSYRSVKGELRCMYRKLGDIEDDIERMLSDIVVPRLGSEYSIYNYSLQNHVLNLVLEKRESHI